MAGKKGNNPKKSKEEIDFDKEFKKLKMSAEHGTPFLEKKKEETHFETKEDFLAKMREFEEAMENPDERPIKEILSFPNFPKGDLLSDEEIEAALELAVGALASKNIELDVIYATPDREIYRFITEELLEKNSGMAGAGGMTTHFVYEEFYPNYEEDIKSDVSDILHFICRARRAGLPWRIANKVSLYGKKVPKEEFQAVLDDHRRIFRGMSIIGVDSISVVLKKNKATAKATFRFYMDKSTGSPGEVSTDAEFFFDFKYGDFCLTRLVIDHFGIK